MSGRRFYFIAVALVTLVSLGLRLYAVPRLDVDYDEPVYLSAGLSYANYMRGGDLKMLAWNEHTYEHPALYKILYGVLLLTQTPLERLPDNDLPRLAPIASTEAGAWTIAARYLSVFWGTLAVLVLSLLNPLAGLLLGVSTLSVKYTSEVYLEALPLFASLLCALAYQRWFALVTREPSSAARHWPWLLLSAASLGMAAASKYIYGVVGLAVLIHFALAAARKQVPIRFVSYIGAWAALCVLLFFAFDPYLWPHPVIRFMKTITFHETFQESRLVKQYHYPFWQPVRWLSAFSSFYDLHPRSAFLVNIDTLIFILAVIGLPSLYRRAALFFWWLVIGFIFLLVWSTKWPQYTLIILAPFSLSAACGAAAVGTLLRRVLPQPGPQASS